jgi:hypothetical protein
MPIYLLQHKESKSSPNKRKCLLDFVSKPPRAIAKSFSKRTYSLESFSKNTIKNKNNNHTTPHRYASSFSSFSTISSNNEEYSNEALAEVTDLEYNFEYNIDNLTISSSENKLKPAIVKTVTNPASKIPPKVSLQSRKLIDSSTQTAKISLNLKPKYRQRNLEPIISSSLKDNDRWSISNFVRGSKKYQPITAPLTTSDSSSTKINQPLDFSFLYKYAKQQLLDGLDFKSLSKRERKFFNFLVNLLLVLLLILVLFYYFLSQIYSSWNLATKVKIENENIYIKL